MIKIGCQGWNYDDWISPVGGEKVFYPQRTRPNDMLGFYAQVFDTVEVDSTFYAIPSTTMVEGWAKRTPQDFTFSLKLPRAITHELALRSEALPLLKEFCERARLLEQKLASVLIQLPPQFQMTADNLNALQNFLPYLPQDIHFSIEFRSREWVRKSVIDQLLNYDVTLALVEGEWITNESMWRAAEYQKSRFCYVRWMGERDLTRFDIIQRLQDENLNAWSGILNRLNERVPNIFAYFSNYYEGHAPASANKLKRLLGQPLIDVSVLEEQPSLF